MDGVRPQGLGGPFDPPYDETMAKYDPLSRFLHRRRDDETVILTFTDIERMIGAILPKAAAQPDWWSNAPQEGKAGLQQRAWLDAGRHAVLSGREAVTFHRSGHHDCACPSGSFVHEETGAESRTSVDS